MEKKMKFSVYNHFFEANGKKYVYNILTTAIVQLDENNYEMLQNNDISQIDDITKKELFNLGVLVDDNTNELCNYQYYYDNTRYSTGANIFNLMFLPTYNCNLRCTYCYEGNDKCFETISNDKVDCVLKFVEKTINNNQNTSPINKMIISLYGGEPMMNKSALIYFCDGVNGIAQKYSIPIYFDMTTNLTLLDTCMVELIKKYNISIQVSIDGAKKFHDQTRITASGQGTYDKIIQNLQLLLDNGLKDVVTIRINTDKNNIDCMEELFEELKKYSNDIYFGILTSYHGFNDGFGDCISQNNIVDEMTQKIHKIYIKNNLPLPRQFGKKPPCSLNSKNKYIVDNFLNVYKCELLVNHKNCIVGKIDDEGNLKYNQNYYRQINYTPFNVEKCKQCKLLPLCAGGCPAKVYINNGHNDGNVLEPECMITLDGLTKYLQDYVCKI